MSPFEAHATGSRAICRQSWHEAKGKKESLERRVACDPHVDLRRDRSWEVKKASDVLRLPTTYVSIQQRASRYLAYYETFRVKSLGLVLLNDKFPSKYSWDKFNIASKF